MRTASFRRVCMLALLLLVALPASAQNWRQVGPPGGDVQSLAAVLANRFGVRAAGELVPRHPTLGDVDSAQSLADYQAAKRAHKARLRARAG